MNTKKLWPVALAALISACQTTPRPNATLEEARQAYQKASTDPQVARAASVELDKARHALVTAEQAWAARHDEDETRHLSYLAFQRAQAAALVGEQRRAEERLQQSGVERERIRADAQAQRAQSAQQQAAQQGDRAAMLQRELEELSARQTNRGMVLAINDVLFDLDKATLKPGAQRTVDRLAAVLSRYPERRLLIEGFTDSSGSEAYNQRLSERRADAVRQALVRAGVPADRIQVQGLGEAYPVADNETAAGRQQNRRVEILFSDAQGQIRPR